ncbi:MAG: hypothetical protein CL701_06370 [Chloroflexi bacterium]|nr:hypothetical protein [Chloroflexota bacterium]|tara:strand:- start:1426 stop:1650 length:225 start_codon:yes stop_codon:yes gene_type:complete
MKISTVIMIFLTTILVSCTSSSTSKWPHGMTPFFAECEGEGGTYTDKEYAKRKRQPCHGGWKFFDRGEPTLTND